MSFTPRLLMTVLGLTLIGCAVLAYRVHRQNASLQHELDLLNDERSAQRLRIQALEKTLQERPSQLTPGIGSNTAEKAKLSSAQENIRQIAEMRNAAGGLPPAARLDKPEMQKLIALQQRATLDFRYAALFRQLKLSPDELEKLKTLLVEKQNTPTDVRAATRAQGINPQDGREVIRELVADAQSETDNKIRSTLGDSVYTILKNYEETIMERGLINQLEQRLSYSSTPLSPDQTERMINLLAETVAPDPGHPANGNSPFANVSGRYATPQITNATLARSEGLLSPEQMAALRQLQQEQEARLQLSRQYRNPINPLRPPGNPPVPGGPR